MSVRYNEFDTIWAPPDRAVNENGIEFTSIQTAHDESDTLVLVGPGTFEENVDITKEGLTMIGVGRATVIDGGATGGAALDVAANNVSVARMSVSTDADSGDNAMLFGGENEEITAQGIRVVESGSVGLNVGADHSIVWGLIVEDSASIGLNVQSGASNNTVGLAIFPSTVSGSAIGCTGNFNTFGIISIDGVGNDGVNDDGIDNTYGLVTTTNVGQDGLHLRGEGTTVIASHFVDSDSQDVNEDGVTGHQIIGCTPESANTPAQESQDVTDAGWVSRLVDSPNATVSNVILDNGDSGEKSIPVADGETLKVYRWGAYQVSDGATPADLDVQLKDDSDTVQASENTADTESTDPAAPVASHTNNSGSTSIFKLAVNNGTGQTIGDPGVGAFFAFIVE